METRYLWDEAKRLANLAKHGLDFVAVHYVMESDIRYEVESIRHGEHRKQVFAYVFERLTVLTVIYLPGDRQRIISFRPAHAKEREAYHDWLENDFNDPR
ncbi:MAG: BrnT family toxin [Propionivibrio sp.]|jgi:uncharacterized DUF497 family protein|nr:BrnT family toxin [Propionivibrio sp.]